MSHCQWSLPWRCLIREVSQNLRIWHGTYVKLKERAPDASFAFMSRAHSDFWIDKKEFVDLLADFLCFGKEAWIQPVEQTRRHRRTKGSLWKTPAPYFSTILFPGLGLLWASVEDEGAVSFRSVGLPSSVKKLDLFSIESKSNMKLGRASRIA